MTEMERRRLALAWIAETPNELPAPKPSSVGWAYDELDALVENQPDLAFDVILEILREQNSESVEAILAAGPLENLIEKHGPSCVGRIEREARLNPMFRHLLSAVWVRSQDSAVLARVEACQGESW